MKNKLIISTLLVGASSAAFAGVSVETPPAHTDGTEIFAGVTSREDSTYGYLGCNYALNGNLEATGWIGQFVGGYGEYDYDGAGGANIDGDVQEYEAGIGYQWVNGATRYSALVAAHYADHDISPADPTNSVQGGEWGAKLKVTAQTELGAGLLGGFAATYSTAFDSYWSQLKVTKELFGLQVGPEVIAMGNEEWDEQRYGLSVGGFKVFGLNTSISAGWYDSDGNGDRDNGLYGAIHTSFRF